MENKVTDGCRKKQNRLGIANLDLSSIFSTTAYESKMSSGATGVFVVFGFIGAVAIVIAFLRSAGTAHNSSVAVRPQPVQLRSVQWNPIVLRRLREQERRSWARDDIESARQEKGGWIVQPSLIRKRQISTAVSQQMLMKSMDRLVSGRCISFAISSTKGFSRPTA